jgi:hypothetical protein
VTRGAFIGAVHDTAMSSSKSRRASDMFTEYRALTPYRTGYTVGEAEKESFSEGAKYCDKNARHTLVHSNALSHNQATTE